MPIEIESLILSTAVTRAGTTVREAFKECVSHRVLGIPFCNDQNEIIGRFSIRHTLKETCIPDHMVRGAHLLGNFIDGVQITDPTIRNILALPVDEFVIPPVAIIDTTAPLVKIISIMEQGNTSYVFVVDGAAYRGIITRMTCAEFMLRTPGR